MINFPAVASLQYFSIRTAGNVEKGDYNADYGHDSVEALPKTRPKRRQTRPSPMNT